MHTHKFITAIVLVLSVHTSYAQLTKINSQVADWKMYGQVKYVGPAKASLQYLPNNDDTTFLLMMYDQRPELKNYFSVSFSSRNNALQLFYETLMAFFNTDSPKNEIQRFQLGNEKLTVYRSPTLGTRSIIISTDKGRIELKKGEIERLFNR